MTFHPVEFHPDAEIDLATIAARYDELAIGLGSEFVLSTEAMLLRVQQFPHLYPAVWQSFRRAVLHRFPFAVVYVTADDAIRVIAVYSLRSNPDDLSHVLTHRA